MSSSPWHGMQGRVPSLMRLSADRKPGEQPKPPANKQSDGFADVVLAAQAAERARVSPARLYTQSRLRLTPTIFPLAAGHGCCSMLPVLFAGRPRRRRSEKTSAGIHRLSTI